MPRRPSKRPANVRPRLTNGFFVFATEFSRSGNTSGLTPQQMVQRAFQKWATLTVQQKNHYKMKSKDSSNRRILHSMKRDSKRNNGFANFLRWYRSTAPDLSSQDLLEMGTRIWCRLPLSKKCKFRMM